MPAKAAAAAVTGTLYGSARAAHHRGCKGLLHSGKLVCRSTSGCHYLAAGVPATSVLVQWLEHQGCYPHPLISSCCHDKGSVSPPRSPPRDATHSTQAAGTWGTEKPALLGCCHKSYQAHAHPNMKQLRCHSPVPYPTAASSLSAPSNCLGGPAGAPGRIPGSIPGRCGAAAAGAAAADEAAGAAAAAALAAAAARVFLRGPLGSSSPLACCEC